MATITFPYNLATVLFGGYERLPDSDVDRTPFDDGSIRQAITRTRVFEVRRFNFVVMVTDKAALDTWLRVNNNQWFNFDDVEDGVTRDVRIRGGRAAVRMVAVDGELWMGEEYFRGEMELEGYW